MRDALRLFESLEITYIPSREAQRRGPRSTCCGNVVQRLILKHGLPHAVIVLKTIIETEGNEGELIADVIHAISDLIRAHPRWVGLGGIWLEAFDKISLAEVRRIAKTTGVQPLRDAIMTLLCLRLEEILGPSKLPKPPRPVRVELPPKPPRSVTRIPEIEKNISLGKELLALRASIACNKQFGRERRRRFPDVDSITAARTMRVARLYAGRPEIWRAASWRTLIELASPKMAPSMRQALEAKILAGETITAPQIRKARGPFKGGSPKRRPVEPVRMAA
jgi:hypothetical protein